MNRDFSTLREWYLELLAAWGELPLDQEEVMDILHRLVKHASGIQKRLEESEGSF